VFIVGFTITELEGDWIVEKEGGKGIKDPGALQFHPPLGENPPRIIQLLMKN
jgi:hypothetical protein